MCHLRGMDERVLLYVEDEDAAVFLFETALKEAGIQLRLCRVSDGEQALAFLRHKDAYEGAPTPDLVLLDLNLPRKNGLDVLAEINRNDEFRKIPTVVFTSSSLASDRNQSISLGAQEYITKPSTFDGFIKAVKAACSYLPQVMGREGAAQA
jgi:CheY-like chemotaxis protein